MESGEKMQILIVEDSMSFAATYREYLAAGNHTCVIAENLKTARRKMAEAFFDAVILDLHLPDGDGITFLTHLRQANNATPVIVVTGMDDVDRAVAAIRAGAADYLTKPVPAPRLLLTLQNATEKCRLKNILGGYRGDDSGFADMAGTSAVMRNVYRAIENAAASLAPVFITGESGTGKELAARAVHQLSPRRSATFEAVNCAAIPANLLESEMFGYRRGAFTGAATSYDGAALRAAGGTLFLDELCEMPIDMQSKMLRFTQDGSFRALGDTHEKSANVRFVSATNKCVETMIERGALRADLYYRLNVIRIALPPLRARGADIVMLAERMLHAMAAEENRDFKTLDDGAKNFLMQYTFPGNVRELQAMLRRAVVMHNGEVLRADMLKQVLFTDTDTDIVPAQTREKPRLRSLKDIERDAIESTLRETKGNISAAARILGVNPSTLHRKIALWQG